MKKKIEILRRDMKLLGLNNKGMADKLGVSENTISNWLRGSVYPRPTSVRIMVEMGISKEAAINPSKIIYI